MSSEIHLQRSVRQSEIQEKVPVLLSATLGGQAIARSSPRGSEIVNQTQEIAIRHYKASKSYLIYQFLVHTHANIHVLNSGIISEANKKITM